MDICSEEKILSTVLFGARIVLVVEDDKNQLSKNTVTGTKCVIMSLARFFSSFSF